MCPGQRSETQTGLTEGRQPYCNGLTIHTANAGECSLHRAEQMSAPGQKRKFSPRAYAVCFTPADSTGQRNTF